MSCVLQIIEICPTYDVKLVRNFWNDENLKNVKDVTHLSVTLM